jgi:glutamate-5-semialdehyde dehydrogenase
MNVRQNIDLDLRATMDVLGTKARAAAEALRTCPASTRTAAIQAMARQVRARTAGVLRANDLDMAGATGKTDRLKLNEARVAGIVAALEQVAELPDPVGAERARWQRPNGLDIARVSTPIGVIGMIY